MTVESAGGEGGSQWGTLETSLDSPARTRRALSTGRTPSWSICRRAGGSVASSCGGEGGEVYTSSAPFARPRYSRSSAGVSWRGGVGGGVAGETHRGAAQQ